MIGPRKFMTMQRILFGSGILLVLYFFLGFQPLSRRAAALDQPLQKEWDRLAKAEGVNAGARGVDLDGLERYFRQMEALGARLRAAGREVTNRLAFDAAVMERVNAPFQLVEFQNERQLCIEEIGVLATGHKVMVDPAVAGGFPEYQTEQKQPGLLWAHLAACRHVLSAAIQCNVSVIHNLAVRAPKPVVPPEENAEPVADELPVVVELSGAAPAVQRFLVCLAMRGEEARAAGLPGTDAAKPALFVERVLLRKDSAEKPDSVRVEVRASGWVYRP